MPGKRGKLCRARNLSANGVFVETENLGLVKGSVVELSACPHSTDESNSNDPITMASSPQ